MPLHRDAAFLVAGLLAGAGVVWLSLPSAAAGVPSNSPGVRGEEIRAIVQEELDAFRVRSPQVVESPEITRSEVAREPAFIEFLQALRVELQEQRDILTKLAEAPGAGLMERALADLDLTGAPISSAVQRLFATPTSRRELLYKSPSYVLRRLGAPSLAAYRGKGEVEWVYKEGDFHGTVKFRAGVAVSVATTPL